MEMASSANNGRTVGTRADIVMKSKRDMHRLANDVALQDVLEKSYSCHVGDYTSKRHIRLKNKKMFMGAINKIKIQGKLLQVNSLS
jgi:hypothetical protein